MRRTAKNVLKSAVEYLYSFEAPTQEEHELRGITLRMLGLIRRELLTGSMHPLDQAAAMQVGSTFDVWRQRTMERRARLAWDLAAAVPDFDPTEAANCDHKVLDFKKAI